MRWSSKRWLRAALTLLGLTFSAGPASALDPGRRLGQYGLDVWKSDRGLPQETLTRLAQSDDGALVIATSDRLLRFDGLAFLPLGLDPPGRTPNGAPLIAPGRNGAVWVLSSEGGIRRLGAGSHALHTTAERMRGMGGVDALAEGAGGQIYFCQRGRLWAVRSGQAVRQLAGLDPAHQQRSSCASVLEDRTGRVWVGRSDGLHELREERLQRHERQGLPRGTVSVLYEDRRGRLWLGTTEEGLFGLGSEKPVRYTADSGLAGNNVRAMLEDGDGNLWVGTGTGLTRLHEGKLEHFDRKEVLFGGPIQGLLEDRDGALWVASRGEGLGRIRDVPFASMTLRQGLSDDFVSALYETQDGSVLIGNRAGGLDRVRDGRVFVMASAGTLPGRTIHAITQDAAGDLWVASHTGTVSRHRGGHWTTFGGAHGLPAAEISALRADRAGRLWLGTNGAGLWRRMGEQFVRFGGDGLPPPTRVSALFEDASGTLWVGTGSGLFRVDGESATRFGRGQGLGFERVVSLYGDRAGDLWIGTVDGLCRRTRGEITCAPRTAAPYPVNALVGDGDGRLWLASESGVFRMEPDAFDAFARGAASKITTVRFGVSEGMQNSSCPKTGDPSALRARDGRLWFATTRGVAYVDPRRAARIPEPPFATIEQVMVGGKVATAGTTLTLPAGGARLEVRFGASSLVAPQKLRFRHRLEGEDVDSSWVLSGPGRQAVHDDLPPGRYRLVVRAGLEGGPWATRGAGLEIFRPVALYRRPPLIALSLTGVTVLVAVALSRLGARRMRQGFTLVMAERTRVARELHDTLLQSLAALAHRLHAVGARLDDRESDARTMLDSIASDVRATAVEARRSILDLRDESAPHSTLPHAISQAAARVAEGTSVDVQVRTSGRIPATPPAVEHHLVRIVQEALTNVVKHAHADKAVVEILPAAEGRGVRLQIRDDGDGLAAGAVAPGHFGIRGMEERAAEIGAAFSIQAGPGRGTEIELVWREPR